MAGIAGVAAAGQRVVVEQMLDRIAHRGRGGRKIRDLSGATLGAVWAGRQDPAQVCSQDAVRDRAGPGHLAEARWVDGRLALSRDCLGVQPLYYGRTDDGTVCFASEVKALVRLARKVAELPPGHRLVGGRLEAGDVLQRQPPLTDAPEAIAAELRRRLAEAVSRRLEGGPVGAWLSGGLDSSAIAALARQAGCPLHTFAGGLPGAPDLDHARQVASFIGARHHEIVVSLEDLLAALPAVIHHLESFDALLVRSSLTNYLVARAAADYVSEVFSGEGGDELFAGYEYLKSIPPHRLADELLDITNRLHNTALQRVDRSASAHGLVAHVCFLDPEVVDYAFRVPTAYKLRDGVEKWILRRAVDGAIPHRVLTRTKAKFWEGAGVGDLLACRAEAVVSDEDFARERTIPDGQTLTSKEELMFYRIFREQFGDVTDLRWMGRTPVAS